MKKYTIELTEDELIRYYANKIIEDSLDDCNEFHYDMNINNYNDNGFVKEHLNQIIDRINKDEKVLEVYFDKEYSTINMVFGMDWCPYYYEDYYLDYELERKILRSFINSELKFLEKVIDVRTTRDLIRQYMNTYIENSDFYEDDVRDEIYYSLKKHICNIGFVDKYIDKYEVYVTKENIIELEEGIENEINKLYFEELPYIRKISINEVHSLIDKYNNEQEFKREELGKFIAKENGIYLGIDNSMGKMYMEDFDDIRKCIDYINGREKDLKLTNKFEPYWNENHKINTPKRNEFELYDQLTEEQKIHLSDFEIINSINYATTEKFTPNEKERLFEIIHRAWLKDESRTSIYTIADRIVEAYGYEEVGLEALENANTYELLDCAIGMGNFKDLENKWEEIEE